MPAHLFFCHVTIIIFMSRDIIITTFKDSKVTDEALYSLFKRSYDQWREQGLDSPFLHTSFEKFQERMKRSKVFVAIDTFTSEPVGVHFFGCNPKKHIAFGYFLAIAPDHKNQGIATRMLDRETEKLREQGYRYMKGSTSVKAIWSVQWHRKSGYLITGYSLGEKSNSATYTFRKPIALDIYHHPLDILWKRPLAPLTARISYMASYTITRLCKTRNGRLNTIGRLAKKVRGFLLKVQNFFVAGC